VNRALAWVWASGARAALSLAVLSGFLQFFHLGVRGLFEPDEGRYGEIPREMIALGDWIVPHLNHVPYLEKPPLVYWMTAGLYRFLGEIPLAARLPSALCTVLAVMVTAAFGRRLLGARAAWMGARSSRRRCCP
jgi:4-amino-4-deoxy-L-arabinose transferase-like glycosyltransferase